MSGTQGDTIHGSDGSSFALTVPNGETTEGVTATYADLVRFGAADQHDEALLNSDPSNSGSSLMGVPSPFGPGGLSYTLDSLQFVAPHGYLRIGKPGGYECWLPTNPDSDPIPAPAPGTSTAASNPFGGTGVVIYSQEQINNHAPTINNTAKSINNTVDNVTTWTLGGVTATYYDKDYTRIAMLSGQAQGKTGIEANMSYQVVNNMSSLIGNSISTIGGQAATIWTGADASTGIGSLLWSNFGLTQNLFGGWISNITNGSVELQGLGEAKVSDLEVLAPKSITFSVAPLGGVAVISKSLGILFNAVSVLGGLFNASFAVYAEAATGTRADKAEGDVAKLQNTLSLMKAEMMILTSVTAALQIASTAAGFMMLGPKYAAQKGAASSIDIAANQIKLSAGGTTVTIGNAGFKVDAGNAEAVTMAAAKMTAVGLGQQQWTDSAGFFLTLSSSKKTSGMSAEQMLQRAQLLQQRNVSAPGVPMIVLNSLLGIKALATNIQFSLPEPEDEDD